MICPECGEILKRAPQETAEKKTAAVPMPDGFAMPFLAATGTDGDSSTTTEDPRVVLARAQEKRSRRLRIGIFSGIAVVLIALVTLYSVFLGGYKLAVYRYVKGVDRCSGAMYTALVPDAYMDYLESTYDTTRREVKEKMHDYFVSWNKNYGNEGGMSYEIVQHEDISDSGIADLESQLKTSYGITADIQKAVSVRITINDGGQKGTESTTFVKIKNRWCSMDAMEDMDYVCKYDGYNEW